MLLKMDTDENSSIDEEELKQQDEGKEEITKEREEGVGNAGVHPNDEKSEEIVASSNATTVPTTTDSEKEGSSSLYRIDSGLLPFPEKLMALLDGNQVSDSMWWLPDGDSFCLIPVVFAEKVLDKHFQGTKFESFTRKLNRWGFKRVAGQKVPANTIAYYNKYFIRGQPKLLKHMNGGKTKLAASRESKREQTKLRRDRQQEHDILMAAQQQAMYADSLGYPSSSLFRPAGLSSLLGGAGLGRGATDLRTNHLLAAEIMAQREREELQMRLALTQRVGGFNPLLAGHHGFNPLLAQQHGLTPLEQQILMARSSAGFPDFATGAGGMSESFKNSNNGVVGPSMDASSGGASAPSIQGSSGNVTSDQGSAQQDAHQQQNNLRAIAAKAAAANSTSATQSSGSSGVDSQVLQYLQEEQRKKEMDLLKKMSEGSQ